MKKLDYQSELMELERRKPLIGLDLLNATPDQILKEGNSQNHDIEKVALIWSSKLQRVPACNQPIAPPIRQSTQAAAAQRPPKGLRRIQAGAGRASARE